MRDMPLRTLFLSVAVTSLAACSASSGDDDSAVLDGGGVDGGAAPSVLTVTSITPDTAMKPAYIGLLKNGNLVLTEGAEHKVDEMDLGGSVTHVNSTDFVANEWPRSIAVDDAGRLFIAGYQQIHTYATAPADPHQTFIAGQGRQTWDWVYSGGSPNRLWALTRPNPTSPRMQFVRFDGAVDGTAGTPTVVHDLARFDVMSFVVDAQNTIFAVDSNSCRIRKITSDGVVTVVAGKPETAQGVCTIGSAYERDADGNLTLPQAGALAWNPSGVRLLLVGAGAIVDVTEQADGTSKGEVLYTFEAGVNAAAAATSADALYVVDSANGTVRKVVF